MKSFFSIILFFLSFSLSLFAQSQQQVIVKEYRDKSQKSPLEGVSLSVQNAGSSISDAQGNLTLQFRTLKAGDVVQVRRVDFSGYEIFNKDAVDQWTISPQKPFQLILCNSNKFKALRDQYMRVSSQSYERQLKQEQARLAALLKENKLQEEAYQQQLAELEENYYEQLDNLENYVDHFARIDLSELSAQEQQLIDLVQEGKMDEAISLYESADYLSKYKQQVADISQIESAKQRLTEIEEQKETARRSVESAIYRQALTYKLAGGRENFSKVTSLLKGMADADTTNIRTLWKYCEHCLTQNNLDECEKYANIYLRQVKGRYVLQIRVCELLGAMFFSKYDLESAEKFYLKAVSLCQEYPSADKSLLIEVQTELHTFYINTNRAEQVLSFTEQLKDDLLQCYTQDSVIWSKVLAVFYSEQGIAYHQTDQENLSRPESLLLKGYQMTEENSEERLYSLNCLSQFYYDTHQWKQMQPYLLEELKIRSEMYAKNPDEHLFYLLGVNINLCELYYHLDNFEQSHQYLTEAESLYQVVSEQYEESAIVFDRMNLSDAASQLYYKEGNLEQARKYAAQCLEAYAKLSADMKAGLDALVQRNKDFLK